MKLKPGVYYDMSHDKICFCNYFGLGFRVLDYGAYFMDWDVKNLVYLGEFDE